MLKAARILDFRIVKATELNHPQKDKFQFLMNCWLEVANVIPIIQF